MFTTERRIPSPNVGTRWLRGDSMGYYDNYLEHHGIKGQRWGVRRFRNADGSLTPKGKKRYGENLDINDRSRQNIAKIRLGEARRRLDVAKENSKTTNNNYRVAELKGRERMAKQALSKSKKIDRGAKYAAKGETISKNNLKSDVGFLAAYVGSRALTGFLNTRMKDLGNEGRLSPAHIAVAKQINTYGTLGMYALAGGNAARQTYKNTALRAYNTSKWDGESTIKAIGSQEYKDVVKRKKGET